MVKELDFQLSVQLSLDLFITQSNFITRRIAFRLDTFVMSLLLKILSTKEDIMTNQYEFLKTLKTATLQT